MLTVEPTDDPAVIGSIVRHPAVYPFVSDDGCPEAILYQPVIRQGIVYLLVKDGEKTGGLFCLVQMNNCVVDWHTCLLPDLHPRKKLRAALMGLDWIWENTSMHRVITHVPEDNPAAWRFAEAGGLVVFGRDPKSFLKGGRLMDRILLGISRPEHKCR